MVTKRTILFSASLILGAFLLWGFCLFNSQFIKQYYHTVSIRLEREQDRITNQKLEEIEKAVLKREEKNKSTITAWEKIEQEEIKEITTEKVWKADMILVYGNMADIAQEQFLYGGFGYGQDWTGCILDKKTAYGLFGDTNVTGQQLKWENRIYTIRGVLNSEKGNVFIRKKEEDTVYHNLELGFWDKENGTVQAENFMNQYGIGGKKAVIDGYFAGTIAQTIGTLPAIVLFFLLLGIWLCQLYRIRKSTLFLLIGILLMIFGITAMKWICGLSFDFPNRFVPSQWSDFDFWSKLVDSIKESLSRIYHLEPSIKDRELINSIYVSIVTAVSASIVFAVWLRKQYKNRFLHFWIDIVFLVILPFVVRLFFAVRGKGFDMTGGFLWALPMVYCQLYWIRRWNNYQAEKSLSLHTVSQQSPAFETLLQEEE